MSITAEIPSIIDAKIPSTADAKMPSTVDAKMPSTTDAKMPSTIDVEMPSTVKMTSVTAEMSKIIDTMINLDTDDYLSRYNDVKNATKNMPEIDRKLWILGHFVKIGYGENRQHRIKNTTQMPTLTAQEQAPNQIKPKLNLPTAQDPCERHRHVSHKSCDEPKPRHREQPKPRHREQHRDDVKRHHKDEKKRNEKKEVIEEPDQPKTSPSPRTEVVRHRHLDDTESKHIHQLIKDFHDKHGGNEDVPVKEKNCFWEIRRGGL
jgi:hypothetical protein